MKLKLFKEAEQELKQFENFEKSEFFYEYYPDYYPNRKGSMVAFGFRMLNAETAHYLGRPDESLSNLHKILRIVENILKTLSDESIINFN